jgi:hypothetical protein
MKRTTLQQESILATCSVLLLLMCGKRLTCEYKITNLTVNVKQFRNSNMSDLITDGSITTEICIAAIRNCISLGDSTTANTGSWRHLGLYASEYYNVFTLLG